MSPDYHIHSEHSGDCDASMEAMCEAAIACGIGEIAFTDHLDFNPDDPGYQVLHVPSYVAAVARCRERYAGRLVVRTGVEIGEPHIYAEEAAIVLAEQSFDVVIGSLHWAGGRPDWSAEYFAEWTLDEGMHIYLDELARLVAHADFDVLGHFDIVRRPVYLYHGLREMDYTAYEAKMRGILRTLIARDKTLELNTANHARGMGETCPPAQVLAWYREEGGERICLGSDAHKPSAVGASFGRALDLLQAAGFARLTTFEARRVHWLSIC
jgi:histidinol-phosphatase (PHP family)